MKMKLISVLGLGVILLFSGCGQTQPSYNPNDKRIVFVKDKPYLIPANARYYPITYQVKLKYTNTTVTCNKGDIIHMSQELEYARCASPLSNQQYQYVLHQQQINANRAATNAQRSAQMAAMTAQNNASAAAMNAQSTAQMNAQINANKRDKMLIIGNMPGGGYYVR